MTRRESGPEDEDGRSGMLRLTGGDSRAPGPPETSRGDVRAGAAGHLVELADLVARMATGESSALGRFYDLVSGRAYALALRIVRLSDAAEEIVEDAFFQAWRDAGRFDPARGNALGWMTTIVRSRALDWLRRREPVEPLDEATLLGQPDGGADPCAMLEALERGTAIHAALATLAPEARQIVALAFFRGLTHQEIAAACRMPIGTVKTTLHRAFGQLRAALKQHAGITL